MYSAEGSFFWFVAKRGLIDDLLKRSVGKERPRVLDAGCGTGGLLAALNGWSEAVGVDPAAEAVRFCRQRGLLRVARARVERMPFASGIFDGVVASDVIEHLEDDRAAVCELHRVLAVGGVLLVTVPGISWLWSPHDVALGHERRYARGRLKKLLVSAGFDEVRIFTYMNFIAPLVIPLRLMQKLLRKEKAPDSADYGMNPAANRFLLKLLEIERFLVVRGADFRIGTTIVGVARKG